MLTLRVGHAREVIALIIGLLVCVAVAVVVVGLVAIPARREGRDVLTTRGEDLVASLRDRSEAPEVDKAVHTD